MTSVAHTLADSATMLRRPIRHIQRYPSLTGLLIGVPVILLRAAPHRTAPECRPRGAGDGRSRIPASRQRR